MNYEELIVSYEEVQVKEISLEHDLKGVYKDNRIIIHERMTQRHKRCILAEELGHHFTSVGNILDVRRPGHTKQEHQARRWGAHLLVQPKTLAKALMHCTHMEELLDYLDVTPEFLLEAVTYFESQYGPHYDVGTHYLVFSPLHLVSKSQFNCTEKACPIP